MDALPWMHWLRGFHCVRPPRELALPTSPYSLGGTRYLKPLRTLTLNSLMASRSLMKPIFSIQRKAVGIYPRESHVIEVARRKSAASVMNKSESCLWPPEAAHGQGCRNWQDQRHLICNNGWGKLGENLILCSDADTAIRSFTKEHDIEHVELNAKKKQRVKQGIYHIQNSNSFHKRLKDWMSRFNGVATKYLDNYPAWFRFITMTMYEAMVAKQKQMLVAASQFNLNATCESLRVEQWCKAGWLFYPAGY